MSWRDRVLHWVEPEDNPSGTVYGTIAAGLVVAAQKPADETYPRVLVAIAVAVGSVWLAHGYAHWAGERLRRGGDRDARSSARRLGRVLTHEWPIIEGGAIPMTALAHRVDGRGASADGDSGRPRDSCCRPRRVRTRRRQRRR